MHPIIKIMIWGYLFMLACAAGASHNPLLLGIAIGASYVFIKKYPIIVDKPTKEK